MDLLQTIWRSVSSIESSCPTSLVKPHYKEKTISLGGTKNQCENVTNMYFSKATTKSCLCTSTKLSATGWVPILRESSHGRCIRLDIHSLPEHGSWSCCRPRSAHPHVECVWPVLLVEDSAGQHVFAEDGDGGRDRLAGVVVDGEVVGVDCLLLEPAIGKRKKIENKKYKKLPWVVHAHALDGVSEGALCSPPSTALGATNQHRSNFGEGGQDRNTGEMENLWKK